MIEVVHELAADDLDRDDLWAGLLLKAREPMRFVAAITACRVVEELDDGFVREITLRGEVVRERVWLFPRRFVRFERLTGSASGSIINAIVERNGELALRFEIALQVVGLASGSPEERDYGVRMEAAYRSAVVCTLREIARSRMLRLARAFAVITLAIVVGTTAGCAAVLPDEHAATRAGAQPPGSGTAVAVAPATNSLADAIRRYDAHALERICAERAAGLAVAAQVAPDASRLAEIRELALASWWLAGMLKFDAMVAAPGDAERAAISRRVGVIDRALPWCERGLATAPDDPELLQCHGELLAYSITSVFGALRVGSTSRAELERAVALGAGQGAELALAKRWYYLPDAAGGDLERAATAVEAIVKRAPTYEPGWAFLGVVRRARGERASADAAFARAVAANPDSMIAAYVRAHPRAEIRR